MKVERGFNAAGEPTITVSVPIPASIHPNDYEMLAALVERNLSRELLAALRRADRDWLNLETKA